MIYARSIVAKISLLLNFMPSERSTFLQRLIKWKFLIVINGLLILFVGVTLGREFFRTQEIQQDIDALQTQANALASRNIALSELQTAVQTESFIEREARLKLGMKKSGEEVVVIQEAGEAGGSSQEAGDGTTNENDPLNFVLEKQESQTRVANASKWWYYFFDKTAYKKL